MKQPLKLRFNGRFKKMLLKKASPSNSRTNDGCENTVPERVFRRVMRHLFLHVVDVSKVLEERETQQSLKVQFLG